MKLKTLYIPIEIKVREFHHRLYLSFEALKKNYRVYLGTKSEIFRIINKKENKGGIFISKGQLSKENLNLIKKKCDLYIACDEEFNKSLQTYLPKKSMQNYCKHMIKLRYNNLNIGSIDKFCSFSKDMFKAAKTIYIKKSQKIFFLDGHPKEDLLKKKNLYLFEKDKKRIKKYYGNFILFNSDFFSLRDINEELNEYKKINKEVGVSKKIARYDEKYYRDYIFYKYKTFLYFLTFLEKVDDDLKNFKIMIRPHPREDISYWKEKTKKFKNIFVVPPTEEITAFILASKGVMHNGCSTAISSLILGKPTSYFYEEKNSSYKHFFQKEIFKSSYKVTNYENFFKWIDILNKSSSNQVWYNEYYKNFKKQKSSCKAILDYLDKDFINNENELNYDLEFKETKISKIKKFFKQVNFLNSQTRVKKLPKIKDGVQKIEVEKYFNSLRKIHGVSKQIKIKQLNSDLLLIN